MAQGNDPNFNRLLSAHLENLAHHPQLSQTHAGTGEGNNNTPNKIAQLSIAHTVAAQHILPTQHSRQLRKTIFDFKYTYHSPTHKSSYSQNSVIQQNFILLGASLPRRPRFMYNFALLAPISHQITKPKSLQNTQLRVLNSVKGHIETELGHTLYTTLVI